MNYLFPTLFIGGCCSLIPSAFAETTEDSITLFKKVTVSASRIEQTAQMKTRSIDSVERNKLEEMQASSVAEALKFEPNVTISGGPIAGNQSVNIRGLEGNKILQVIDGSRVNTNFSHRPSYFLDPSLINRIDVVKGPVSSLWGSGAVGGVIAQQTISAKDLVKAGKSVGGVLKAGFNNNGEQSTTTAAIAGEQDEFDWLVAANYLDSGAMEQGNGATLFGSETKNSTLLAKANWQVNPSNALGVNFRHADNDGIPPTVGSTNEALNESDNLIDRESIDQHLSVNYEYSPTSKAINIDVKIYQNDTRIEEINLSAGKDVSAIETLGFSVTNQISLNKLNLLTGIDGYADTLRTKRPDAGSGRPNPPDDATTDILGVFVYGDYLLSKQVVIEAGLRYDGFESKAQGFKSSEETAHSPSLAIRWQVNDWAALSIRYDEAFRAPDVYELFMDGTHFAFFPGGPTNVFVPNPDLEPETSSNIELKGDFELSDVLANDKLNIVASVFENQVDDFIQLSVTVPETIPGMCFAPGMGVGCAGTSTSENIANARLTGFEFSAIYQLGAFSTALSYGRTRGKDSDNNEYLSGIPAEKWVMTADYGIWPIDTKIGFKAIKVNDQRRVPSDDTQGPYAGYTTVDFYASWESSEQSLEGLKVDLTVANAFDQNYRNAWASVFEAGRSIRLAAQYRF
ncbi:MAG: hemoglobin/transferrin/lactoferrin receptor protein [Oceanicoccus sp.]|jgi:hemoglobin/transferrin/lactoferrin receptor protein